MIRILDKKLLAYSCLEYINRFKTEALATLSLKEQTFPFLLLQLTANWNCYFLTVGTNC